MAGTFNNYGKTVWRNVHKNPLLSFIKLMGLLVGTVASMLIFSYAAYEASYDTFQPQYQHLYRVVSRHFQQGELQRETAFTVPALGPAVAAEIPGIIDYFRLTAWAQSYTMKYQSADSDPIIYKERQAYFSDASIIHQFGLHLVQGNPERALTAPAEVLLSTSTATRYFGSDWPRKELIGQSLEYHDTYHGSLQFTIAGVFKDIPENAHLQFDVLFSHATLPLFLPEEIPPKQRAEMFDVSWGPPSWYTYLVLDKSVTPETIGERITALVKEHNTDKDNVEMLVRQPIQDIHLYSNMQDEASAPGSANQVTFLTVIGCLTLFIAWGNYTNLSVIKGLNRVKEVALRKVFSATPRQLIKQFMAEAFILQVIVLLIAIASVWLTFPLFTDYLNVSIQFPKTSNPLLWGLFIIPVLSTLVTGLYPALLLSKVKVQTALKNKISLSQDRMFRSGLVVFQLGLGGVLLLLVITFTAVRQVKFMQDQGSGVDMQRTMVIESPNVLAQEADFAKRLNALRASLEPYPAVQSVTAVDFIPGSGQSWNIQAAPEGSPDKLLTFRQINVDFQYLETIGAHFLAGEDFSSGSNEGKVIINRRAAQVLGYREPQQALHEVLKISHGGWTPEMEIIGVVENYFQQSLQHAFEPIIFFPNLSQGNVLVKFSAGPENVSQSVERVRDAWAMVFPDNPFDYFFLRDFYQQQYQADVQFAKTFRIGTWVAVFIAIAGLIALISFTLINRRKEIGIRKVLGASVSSLLILLTKRTLGLTIMAGVLATPLAYWLVSRWLDHYAFRIELHALLFAIPILCILGLVLLTLSFQTVRAARANPVNILHDE